MRLFSSGREHQSDDRTEPDQEADQQKAINEAETRLLTAAAGDDGRGDKPGTALASGEDRFHG